MTTTFATIGSGRRTRFFLRLARAMPECLRVSGVVTRTRDARTRSPPTGACRPSARSVTCCGTNGLTTSQRRCPGPRCPMRSGRWSGTGCRCSLRHRPPRDLPGLRTLWTDVGGTGLVQVAEQYLLMPGSFEETLDWVIAYRLEGLQVSEKAFSHTTEAEIADLAQRTSDLGLSLELAGPSVKPGRGGNTVASLRLSSYAAGIAPPTRARPLTQVTCAAFGSLRRSLMAIGGGFRVGVGRRRAGGCAA